MIRRLPFLAVLLAGCPEGLPIPTPTPLVALPGGEFTMGWAKDCADGENLVCDPSAWAERQVQISPFAIDRHEVTNAQYRYCVAVSSCDEPVATGVAEAPDYYSDAAFDDHPVIFVSWTMAYQYCKFLGRRLPSEAEWEFAARTREDGKHTSEPQRYPWGNDVPACNVARLKACGQDLPVAVESVVGDVSSWGVRDLGGNVAEWVADLFSKHAYCDEESSISTTCKEDKDCTQSRCFDGDTVKPECVLLCSDLPARKTPFCLGVTSKVTDPRTKRGGPDRSIRGGSFSDGPCAASSYFRRHSSPDGARAWTGFRCAGTTD